MSEERDQLKKRLQNLEAYIGAREWYGMVDASQLLLLDQRDAMWAYLAVLLKRIARAQEAEQKRINAKLDGITAKIGTPALPYCLSCGQYLPGQTPYQWSGYPGKKG
jgi:hypothetical protein